MSVSCNICSGAFQNSPDSVVLCAFKDGVIHLGCCIHNCSQDNRPCKHSLAIYDKLESR
ncbi:MAG: hypothetical protein ABH840_01895 [Nanoarchaeota archaeon]